MAAGSPLAFIVMIIPPNNPPPPEPPVVSPPAQPPVMVYVMCLCAMGALGIAAVFGILLVRPEEDNTAIITQIVGMVGIVTTVLVGLIRVDNKIHGVHVDVNSRLSQLVAETRRSALSEGREQGKAGMEPVGTDAREALPAADAETPVQVEIVQPADQPVPVVHRKGP